MAHAHLGLVLRYLRRLADLEAAKDLTDGQLLHQFTSAHDESAFTGIVQRHGRLVMNVCRHVLRHEQDAEDAFQATFLVLARKAGSIRKGEALAGWLHKVAYHLAKKVQRSAVRRRNHERRVPPLLCTEPQSDLALRELQAILDAEVQRLPESLRAPFVLCCLEGYSKTEAARRLGWKEGTVSGRLARARQQLQHRLTRRGVTLSAALCAVAVAPVAGKAAVPALLAATTVQAAVLYGAGHALPESLISAHVAGLLQGMTHAMTFTKAKIAAVLLLVGFCATGVGVWRHAGAAAQSTARPQAEGPHVLVRANELPRAKEVEQPNPADAKPDPEDRIPVGGQVLDPDGEPVANARLYWPLLLKQPFEQPGGFAVARQGTTDAAGRFHLELARKRYRLEVPLPLIAVADGFGVDWVPLRKGDRLDDLKLRLVKDQPIRGRLLDTEGKPLAGVSVSVSTVFTMPEERLDSFLSAWKQGNLWQDALRLAKKQLYLPLDEVLGSAPTDNDGRFQITGAGAERLVMLGVKGSSIAQVKLFIASRAGLDTQPINQAVHERIPPELRLPGQPPLLYGPSFDYVAEPTRPIEGTVRAPDSGKPLAGVSISATIGWDNSVYTVSDVQGRYQLLGLPKMKEYLLSAAFPQQDSSFLRRSLRVPDTTGLQPLKVDIELARGVVIVGRVIDKATGKGVTSGLRFAPLPDNKYFGKKPGYDSYRSDRTMVPTDTEGRFRLVTIPGSGVLMAQTFGGDQEIDGVPVKPYKQATFDAADRTRVAVTDDGSGSGHFTAVDNSVEGLSIQNACKVLDLAEDAGTVTCDLFVDRGQTLTVNLQDAQGKPLTGVLVAGMTDSWPILFPVKTASCTIYALDPERPRQLVFLHADRQLAGALVVRGDEQEPITVRLAPTGTVTGRLLDSDGQPIAGAEVEHNFPTEAARELFRHLNLQRAPVRTHKDGRFRLEGVIPDLKFGFGFRKGSTILVGEPRLGWKQVASGATLDLGEVRTKPWRP